MEIDVEALAKEAELGHAWHGPEKCHCHDRMPALLAAIRQLERERDEARERAERAWAGTDAAMRDGATFEVECNSLREALRFSTEALRLLQAVYPLTDGERAVTDRVIRANEAALAAPQGHSVEGAKENACPHRCVSGCASKGYVCNCVCVECDPPPAEAPAETEQVWAGTGGTILGKPQPIPETAKITDHEFFSGGCSCGDCHNSVGGSRYCGRPVLDHIRRKA